MSENVTKYPRWRWGLYLGVLFVALAFAAGYYFRDQQRTAAAPMFTYGASADSVVPASGFSEVVKKTVPAVVNVYTTTEVKAPAGLRRGGSPFDMFEEFFGEGRGQQGPQRPQQPRKQRGLGSGVILTQDGYVLTNNHVVEGATEVKVALRDRREFSAKVVGGDKLSDIAVLKIEASGLPVLPVGNSDKIEIGDVALAIGNPFGVGQTVTMGIVSATGRRGFNFGQGGQQIEDFIQTDAAINRGNSGGALINTRGELIGINSAIYTPSGVSAGIGFAIPINMARDVMTQLITKGKVSRGYLGIGPQDLDATLAEANGLPRTTGGAMIRDVTANSPASKAGLREGDIILKVNNQPIEDANELILRVSRLEPNTVANLTIRRDGKDQNVAVTLGTRPDNVDQQNDGDEEPNAPSGKGSQSSLSGVSVEPLTPEMARQFRIPDTVEGVVVTDVDADSPASESDLRPGDIIQSVRNQPVRTVSEFNRAVSAAAGKTVMLRVNRRGQSFFLGIAPKQQ